MTKTYITHLVIRFETLRERVMDHVAHVWLVNAHSKPVPTTCLFSSSFHGCLIDKLASDSRYRGTNDAKLAMLPALLHSLSIILVHSLQSSACVNRCRGRLMTLWHLRRGSAWQGFGSPDAICPPCPHTSSSTSNR